MTERTDTEKKAQAAYNRLAEFNKEELSDEQLNTVLQARRELRNIPGVQRNETEAEQ